MKGNSVYEVQILLLLYSIHIHTKDGVVRTRIGVLVLGVKRQRNGERESSHS
jgi:hypothetical protein